MLVPALARLGDIGWRCVCAGSLDRAPAYAATIAAAVRDAGLGNRVRLVGECAADALDRLYDGSSVFVLPSHYEGYGMVLTEALARGLPVVATTGGAIPHTVPAAAGILVPPGDDGALADALRALLTEPSGARRRAEMGEAARRHSAGLPGWEQAAMCFAAATLALAPD